MQTGTGLRQREQRFFCSKSQEGRTQRTWPRAVLSGEVSGLLHPGSQAPSLGATPPARPPHLASQPAQPSHPSVGSEWMDAELRRSSWGPSPGCQLHWLPPQFGELGVLTSQRLQTGGQRRISEMIVKSFQSLVLLGRILEPSPLIQAAQLMCTSLLFASW